MFAALKSFLYNRLWNLHNRCLPVPTDSHGKDVKIFVITHNDKPLSSVFSNRDIYVPLRVGADIHASTQDAWLKDNQGDNISRYNLFVNEITGIYWIAKHYTGIGNPEYIGIFHYRRFLQWDPSLLSPTTIITTSGTTLKRQCDFWPKERLRLFREKFLSVFGSACQDDYDAYWNTHTFYYSNLFIMPKALFFEYFEFLEKCLTRIVIPMIDSKAVNLDHVSAYQKRLYSFYLEHLTSYWIYMTRKARGIRHITTRETFFNIPNLETSLH